jgi:glycosyltransferase involved in cell wall biosynthesis
MRKLTILYVESTKAMGGQELATLRYTQGLSKRGHRIVLIIQPDSPLRELVSRMDMIVEPVRMSKASFVRAVLGLIRIINRYQADIVQSNSSLDSWLLSVAVRLARKRPLFIRVRHICTPLKKSVSTRLLYRRLFDIVVVTGGELVRKGLVERDGLKENRVMAIPIGYDQSFFTPQPNYRDLRKELRLPEDHLLVGIIAYLRHYKGHRTLIEAAEKVCQQASDVTFLIVGEGPEEANLKAFIHEKGLDKRVILLGYRDDLLDIYQSLDLFVHPSTEAETLPQSILQAMAMGKPVISTPVGSIPEAVVDGVSGFVVPVKNSLALADRILQLLRDREAMKRMGQKGQEIASRYTVEHGLGRLEKMYDEAIGGTR